jgi:hypothetical protein
VRIVNAKWEPESERDRSWAEEEEEEEVEGCCERDFGWMEVWYAAMVEMYWGLGGDAWDLEYIRPSKVKHVDLDWLID